jgi:DnaJ-class molecular chaperone
MSLKLIRHSSSICPFKTLELPINDLRNLKKNYYRLCKEYHPDTATNLSKPEMDIRKHKFQQVQNAYKTLSTRSSIKFHSLNNNYKKEEPGPETKKEDMTWFYNWIYVSTFVFVTYYFIGRSYRGKRQREQDLAWEVYSQRSREDGLEDIVGNKR